MFSLFKELLYVVALSGLGIAYSISSGLAPAPWVETELQAGEIRLFDAKVIGPLWVDARSEAEYRERHIDGALLLNEDIWNDGIFDLMGAWLNDPRPIVVYCSGAGCEASKKIAERLRNDLTDAEIYTLQGGWEP